MATPTANNSRPSKGIKRLVESVIFDSKWLLIPFYVGLIVAQIVYLYWYSQEIVKLLVEAQHLDKEVGMLLVLELVDVVMIANLIKMIISGSYHSFVSKNHNESSEEPSSGLLKVKMGTPLIGLSSIHLLQSFINSKQLDWDTINEQLCIHAAFLLGALVLAVIEHLHVRGEKIEHEIQHKQ